MTTYKCSICQRFNIKPGEGEAKVCALGLAKLMRGETICQSLEAKGIDFVAPGRVR